MDEIIQLANKAMNMLDATELNNKDKILITDAIHKIRSKALTLTDVINWVACKEAIPKENQKVLTYNQYRIMSNSWCKYTDQDDEWFKNRFTHWAEIPKLPCL